MEYYIFILKDKNIETYDNNHNFSNSKNHVINTICNFWEKPFYKYVYMLLYMCNVKCIFYLFKNDRNKIKINYELLLTLFCI